MMMILIDKKGRVLESREEGGLCNIVVVRLRKQTDQATGSPNLPVEKVSCMLFRQIRVFSRLFAKVPFLKSPKVPF